MEEDSDFYRLNSKVYKSYTNSDEMKKFFSGFLLNEILNRFSSKLESTLKPDRSMWLYFAHDLQIQFMLNSLGINTVSKLIWSNYNQWNLNFKFSFQHRPPPYSSCLFFELYQGDNDPYVKLFYKNSTETSDLPQLEIPKCGETCSLKKLYELYDHILPKRSHAEECILRDGEERPTKENTELFPLG